ncbi:MAG: PorT family protein [Bacteroidales bacterium]|nr:PorT family protein [Bacteroidales bacterium]
MSDKFKHIDEYYKKQLRDIEEDTSRDRWGKLSLLLFWKKFRLWLGLSLIVATAVIIGILYVLNYNINNDYAQSGKSQIIKQDLITNDSVTNSLAFQETIKDKHTPAITENGKEKSVLDKKSTTDTEKNIPTKSDRSFIHPSTLTEDKELKAKIISNPDNFETKIISKLTFKNTCEIQITDKKNIITEIANRSHSTDFAHTPDISTDGLFKPPRTTSWSMDIYIAPSYVTKSLSAEPINEDYLNIRNNSENPVYSTGLGAEVKFSINNWFIQSGINYSVYGDNAKYNFKTNVIDSINCYYNIDTTWMWIYDPPFIGEPYPIGFDSVWMAVYKKIESATTIKNRYEYIEIPALIGYHTKKKKWNYEISTGVSFGFLVSAKGKIPDLTNNYLIEIDKSNEFIRNTSINYIFQAGIQYRLNSRMSLIAKPFFKHNLKSMYKNNFPVKQKFSTFGIITGIRIML